MELSFGEVSVARVIEYYGDAQTAPEAITPNPPRELWDTHRSRLVPDHLNAAGCSSAREFAQ